MNIIEHQGISDYCSVAFTSLSQFHLKHPKRSCTFLSFAGVFEEVLSQKNTNAIMPHDDVI